MPTFLSGLDDLRNIQILEIHVAFIHDAGFDDACIFDACFNDSTNDAYIIDAHIYHIDAYIHDGGGTLSVTEKKEKRDYYRGILGVGCMYLLIAWMHA